MERVGIFRDELGFHVEVHVHKGRFYYEVIDGVPERWVSLGTPEQNGLVFVRG